MYIERFSGTEIGFLGRFYVFKNSFLAKTIYGHNPSNPLGSIIIGLSQSMSGFINGSSTVGIYIITLDVSEVPRPKIDIIALIRFSNQEGS